VQFAIVLHLLQQKHPMLEYEAMKPLHEFSAVLKTSKKHWSDNFEWTIIEFMHQKFLETTSCNWGYLLHCFEL
jgi:hypothetical protein